MTKRSLVGQSNALIESQRCRSVLRGYFNRKGYLEVDTPSIMSDQSLTYGGVRVEGTHLSGYLRSVITPFVRQWVAQSHVFGVERVYAIGHCFRDEPADRTHYPIYECLGIASLGVGYQELMKLIEDSCVQVCKELKINNPMIQGSWHKMPYEEIDPSWREAQTVEELLDRYDLVTSSIKESTFVTELPEILFGPAVKSGQDTKERAELFIDGLEIANISTFQTDFTELRSWVSEKSRNCSNAMEKSHLLAMKEISGKRMASGAIGLSRLFQCLLGVDDIKEVISFPTQGGKS